MLSDTEIKNLKKDSGMELFPYELDKHSLLLQKLSLELMKKRGNPKNYRKFESDIKYNAYPDIFPSTLSELLQEGLTCVEYLEAKEEYEINFSFFHTFKPLQKKCYVNMIGALIAVRFRINYSWDVLPFLFPADVSSKFQALSLLEEGKLEEALKMLFKTLPDSLPPKITPLVYDNKEPEKCKEGIKKLILKLKESNL